ncbi:MAG TPA: alpha/beta hydrolase domain-containing protein [Burkholderiales bacterium]|nr:alpha/beta hydrolase domain-containing protein [Burkholderiales bacterium]
MSATRILNVLLTACSLLACADAGAKLVKLEIDRREVVADGASFGDAGPYEKLTGRAWFEVDPAHERNKVVFDLDHAPRNARGRVAFSADMVILKPVDLRKGSRTLFFEVNNRGRKISFGRMQDTAADANMNDPTSARDFGNGFLLRRGYVIAWVGWGADIAPGDNRLTVNFPIALENGRAITERILTEFSDRNFNGGRPWSLPLSGGAAFKPFPAVSTDKAEAQAGLYVLRSDSPEASGPDIPRGEPVPADQWAFADCPDGWPGRPSTQHICLKEGFRNDRNYHLIYRATDSPVMGLGYVTTRDFVSFLRYDERDEAGNPNPVPGLKTILCQGISSSGMYLRDFLYQGFNVDEAQRQVCQGMHIHVAGVQKLYLNYRFAQPNPFTQQHRERYVPDTNFPRQYAVRINPFTNVPDGILKRPTTDPKIIHTDTSNEYWQFRASLTGASEGGSMDFNESSKVRRYLLSSLQHGGFKPDVPNRGIADRQCEQLSNTTHPGPLLRALVADLDDWVGKGVEPPASRVPKISSHTLVEPSAVDLPRIPGVSFHALHNGSGDRDFGPRVHGNSGVIDLLVPATLAKHKVLVPQVDRIGNDIAGIRHPYVEAPVATLLGWNTRTPEFGGPDLCDLLGSSIPLPKTKADARAAGDPRPSLEELYATHEGYVEKVTAAAKQLQAERLMLQEDVDLISSEAQASGVLR